METDAKPKVARSTSTIIIRGAVALAILIGAYFALMAIFLGRLTPPTKAEFRELAVRHQPIVQAVYRYKAKNGSIPKRLEDLVPDFLASVPTSQDLDYDGERLMIHANAPHTAVCYSFRREDEGWYVGGDFYPGRLDVPKPPP